MGKPKNDYAMYRTEKYLKMGLTQTEIAKLLDTSLRQVIRWKNYIEKAQPKNAINKRKNG